MTFKRLIIFGFLLWALLAALKLFLFKVFDLSSAFNQLMFGILVVIATLACARRLGVLNYLEAIMVGLLWFLAQLFWDFVVLAQLLGLGIYKTWQLWAGYGLVFLVIFFFHKKRHVHVRRELAQHHHK